MKASEKSEAVSQKIVNAIQSDISASDRSVDGSDELDRVLELSNKKHRNFLSSLNHWYVIIIHPAFIFGLLCIFGLGYGATKYCSLWLGNEVLSVISKDLATLLSYLITVIVTAVFTKFIENHTSFDE
ncbi:hypothetical protein FACS1894151_00890 [Spirochaetia bacterium]|nr:hypothetical protein FACS1894151_00890 [Spirochaetia bacterium]